MVCATQSDALMGRVTLYLYDADGNRVAKGHSASNPNVLACSTGGPDFVADLTYAIGKSGEQVSEFAGDNNSWNHTNVFAGGRLIATYDQAGLHYHVNDALGSRRLQVDGDGRPELQCNNLPFEESTQTIPQSSPLSAGVTDATEHHFTGKERDAESGLDNFGSSMGRFMSPDPLGGHLELLQSLNKYAYVMNNPLRYTDPTGMDIWLKGCGDNSATCKDNYVGTTDKDGNFSRTHLTGDQTKDTTLGEHGLNVKQGDKTYEGVWDTNKGENGTVTVAGTRALKAL